MKIDFKAIEEKIKSVFAWIKKNFLLISVCLNVLFIGGWIITHQIQKNNDDKTITDLTALNVKTTQDYQAQLKINEDVLAKLAAAKTDAIDLSNLNAKLTAKLKEAKASNNAAIEKLNTVSDLASKVGQLGGTAEEQVADIIVFFNELRKVFEK